MDTAANRQKWVDALRSGEYTQAKSYLTKLDMDGGIAGHCCLGVACQLYAQEHPEFPVLPQQDERFIEYGTDGRTGHLPTEVQAWLGLNDDAGLLAEELVTGLGIVAGSLTALNDTASYTFEQIAEVIEQDRLRLEG